jgi:RNA polymerase sigma-70 factor (ECF subfamily)
MDTTPPTLLARLRNSPSEAAWAQFVHLYTPMLFAWARQAGEPEEAAADLVQDILTILVQTLPSFDPGQGRFRSWLRTVALNKLRDS